jgi:tRNA dimethylallyltransferase
MSPQYAIHVLTGCTAVGKTEAALQWAEVNQAEIVSCDSLLFYRGMDIGTAKPTHAELNRVQHHLIDICEPSEPMDIAKYVGLAQQAIKDLTERDQPILVTGGSGFYLKAFFGPVVDNVTVPLEVRQRVEGMSLREALAELLLCNPAGLGSLDTANPRRVSRALERCIASSRSLLDLKAEFAAQPALFLNHEIKLVELVRDANDLDNRIRQRVLKMIEHGLVQEVQTLIPLGLTSNPSAAGAIGYREVSAMLEGKLPTEALVDEIVKNTRALVKKQRTWFRTQLPKHPVFNAEGVNPNQLFGI